MYAICRNLYISPKMDFCRRISSLFVKEKLHYVSYLEKRKGHFQVSICKIKKKQLTKGFHFE